MALTVIEHWLTLIRESSSEPWAIPAFAGCYLLGTSLLMPAVSFHVLAGLTWGLGPGILVSELGLNVAGNVQFLIGRKLGQKRVSAWLLKKNMGRVEEMFHANGLWGMIALRQMPLPFVGVNLMAGASPLRWWHFAVGSAVGALPPMVVYTWFAAEIYNGVAGAKQGALWRGLLAGAAMVLIAVLPKLVSKLRQRQTSPK
ncbi:MAG: VTT domain-containing protein [Myxococcaceae bacterium]